MKQPRFLKAGDRVGLVSPAGKVSAKEIKTAVKVMQSWGLEPVFGRHIFSKHFQFAGTDEQRMMDIQEFIDDIDIKAIIASRGGYGSARIINRLDFSKMRIHPKWFVGYSDITVFHGYLHSRIPMQSLHATMPKNFPDNMQGNASVESLRKALFGELTSYDLNSCRCYRSGEASAPIVGGNLSILNSINGTPGDIDTQGKILFIEDIQEYLYHTDRMMQNLKWSGKLSKLKGLIVGGLTQMKDNEDPFGQSAEEIIWEAVKDYDYPVVMNFPAGHQEPNLALYFGREASMVLREDNFKLEFL
ncbi:MAG: LD-carboxypeptidase [Bacteroidetes bacterium 4572_77]|nr:MAG: LD-carboxypeptidase [Bacteroidetes bacterium 4572_77]